MNKLIALFAIVGLTGCVANDEENASWYEDYYADGEAPLPADIGAAPDVQHLILLANTYDMSTGDAISFDVRSQPAISGTAPVAIILADGNGNTAICPEPMEGECLNMVGETVVLGPFGGVNGGTAANYRLPNSFTGDRFFVQAALKKGDGIYKSNVIVVNVD